MPLQDVLDRQGDIGLVPELNQDILSNLDQRLQLMEANQTRRLLDQQEERGMFHSGQTARDLIEQVLGPGIQRRQEALLPLARESALMGREERLGETGFQRQRQFAGEEFGRQRQFAAENFERRLIEMSRQAEIQKTLMELEDRLLGRQNSFGNLFMRNLGSSLGKGLGEGLGHGFTGGLGTLLGGKRGTSET